MGAAFLESNHGLPKITSDRLRTNEGTRLLLDRFSSAIPMDLACGVTYRSGRTSTAMVKVLQILEVPLGLRKLSVR